MRDNILIVFEGAHGTGKTTQANLLCEYLNKNHYSTIYSKEPFLKEIKNIVNNPTNTKNLLDSPLLLFLHAADRIIHLNWISDKFNEYDVIISDRYLLSSCVYQQIQGFSIDFIEKINSFCTEPSLTFLLDLESAERKKRLVEGNLMRCSLFFEEKNFQKERELYLQIYERYRAIWDNIFLIDSSKSREKVFDEIKSLLPKIKLL